MPEGMGERRARVAIVTSMPRAERVHVYNEMARLNEVDFKVFYLRRMAYGRHWDQSELPEIRHDAEFVPELRLHKHLYLSPGLHRRFRLYEPTLMIMTQYASVGMQMLMWRQSVLRRPWVFWSEPPNVRFGDDPIVPFEWLRSTLRELALLPVRHWAREVWGTGQRAVKEFIDDVGCRSPVLNLPYYADLDRFFETANHRRHADRVRFLFCGSLSRRKAADVVATAAGRLAAEGLDFELHVAGKGPLVSDFETLPERARSRIHLLGFKRLSELPTLYAATDVLLFPSRHDGWGMTLMEGMASGQPVISTAQTGSAVDMIRNGENGFLLDSADADALADAMRRLIVARNLIAEMGRAAMETARRYTHREGARAFLDRIHSLRSV